MKYVKQIVVLGMGLQVAVMTPFIIFEIIKEPWWADLVIIANSFWIGRIVSHYFRHVKGKCMSCGHGDYYHTAYEIAGRTVPSCFHKKGKFTRKEKLHDLIPSLFSLRAVEGTTFCRCENYVTKSVAIERIRKNRIEP